MATEASIVAKSPDVFRLRTDELDEALEQLGRRFGAHSRIPLERGPLGLEIHAAISGRVASGYSRIGVRSMLRSAVAMPTLHVYPPDLNQDPRRVAEYRVGRRILRGSPGSAVFLAEGHDYTLAGTAGCVSALQVAPSLLNEELTARVGERASFFTPRSFEARPPAEALRRLEELLQQHALAVHSAESAGPDRLEVSERRLAAWMADLVLENSALRQVSRTSIRLAEDIEAWIGQHLAEPITLDRLQAVACVSSRCLQKACLARWGQTPLELVTSRRLRAARERLQSRSTRGSVTQAALSSGFSHLGRFAGLYKRTFGESPSDTASRP